MGEDTDVNEKTKDKSDSTPGPSEKATITLPGVVEKIIRPNGPDEPEKVQIAIEGADEFYREIRVESTLHDSDGNPVGLKNGAEIEVTVETQPECATPKRE
jgi:hypothetical protein